MAWRVATSSLSSGCGWRTSATVLRGPAIVPLCTVCGRLNRLKSRTCFTPSLGFTSPLAIKSSWFETRREATSRTPSSSVSQLSISLVRVDPLVFQVGVLYHSTQWPHDRQKRWLSVLACARLGVSGFSYLRLSLLTCSHHFLWLTGSHGSSWNAAQAFHLVLCQPARSCALPPDLRLEKWTRQDRRTEQDHHSRELRFSTSTNLRRSSCGIRFRTLWLHNCDVGSRVDQQIHWQCLNVYCHEKSVATVHCGPWLHCGVGGSGH